MEYLAANEAVLTRRPFSLRLRIKDDQWLSTLQFCMETETGGVYFAGELVEQVIKYLFDARRKEPPARMYLLRVAALLSHCERVPEAFLGEIQKLADVLLPPQTLSEAEDCRGIPFECLRELLHFSNIGNGYDAVYLAAILLSEHDDNRCSEIMMTGYERYADMSVIQVLNRSGRIAVNRHFALLRRLENESYTRKVFFDAEELTDSEVKKRVSRKTGIRFPIRADVMWLPERGCYDVTLIEAHRRDWEIMLACQRDESFRSVLLLELDNCIDFSAYDIGTLFRNVEVITINDCHFFGLLDIQRCNKLRKLEFRAIAGPIELPKAGAFGNVKEITLRNCGHQPHATELKESGILVEVIQ